MPPPANSPASFSDLFTAMSDAIARAIKGKDEVIDLALTCLVSEGHLLIEDVPGVGKTSIAKAIARCTDGTFGRIQFTPDLLPSDVIGVSVWNRGESRFEFRRGPVFASMVLGDEVNRASPKTQAALLEAMAEGQVTVDGTTYELGSPFMVIATQNPIGYEGTYPLPESQLDRFLMRVEVGYPAREAEIEVLDTHDRGDPLNRIDPVVTTSEIRAMADMSRSVHMARALKGYLVDLIDATRHHPQLELGASTRAALGLQRASRSRALALGRGFVLPDDIKSLAIPVLAHRLLPTPEAQIQAISSADVLSEILAALAVPTGQGD